MNDSAPRPQAVTIPLKDQLAAVERLLTDLRWARNDPTVAEYATFHALRAVARGLAARAPGEPEECRRQVGRRIAVAVRARGVEWDQGALANVGLEVVSRWPVIEQALERFEAHTQKVDR